MTKSAFFLTLCHLGEDACSPHERSDMRDRPRMSPAAARSRNRWLIRATDAATFHMLKSLIPLIFRSSLLGLKDADRSYA